MTVQKSKKTLLVVLGTLVAILMTIGSATAQLEWDGSGNLVTAMPNSYNITSNTYRSDHFFGQPNANGFVSSIGNVGGMLGNSGLGITKAEGWEVDFGWASIGDDVFPGEKHFISMGDDTSNINVLLDNPSGDEFGGTARLLSNGVSNRYSTPLATGLKFSQPSRSEDAANFHRFQLRRAPGADNVTLSINGSQVADLTPDVCGLPGCDGGNLNVFYIGPSQQEGTFDYINVKTIPEPATLVLLGLGGLALVARRRRA